MKVNNQKIRLLILLFLNSQPSFCFFQFIENRGYFFLTKIYPVHSFLIILKTFFFYFFLFFGTVVFGFTQILQSIQPLVFGHPSNVRYQVLFVEWVFSQIRYQLVILINFVSPLLQHILQEGHHQIKVFGAGLVFMFLFLQCVKNILVPKTLQ